MEQDGVTQSLISHIAMLWAGIAYVGWYILGAAVVLFFAAPYLEQKYTLWKRRKDEAEYSAKYHKNPDLLEQRLRGIEQAREKMQQKYNISAKTALEMEQERKEAKRQELVKLMENQTSGRRLGSAGEGASTSNQSSSKVQNDYYPLMGNSSQGYRPPKRSSCGKGGCGQ